MKSASFEPTVRIIQPTQTVVDIAFEIEDILEKESPERSRYSMGTDRGIFCPSPLAETSLILLSLREAFPNKTRYLSLGSGDGGEAFLAARLGFQVTAAEYDYELSAIALAVESDILRDREIKWEDDFFDLNFREFDLLYYFDRGCDEQERLKEKLLDEIEPGALLCVYRQSESWPSPSEFCKHGFRVVSTMNFDSSFEGGRFNTYVYQRTSVPFERLTVS